MKAAWKELRERLANQILVLDGAMGTQLHQMIRQIAPKINLMGEDAPELLNVTHPEIVREVHRRYLAAGSDLILTNSFGGNAVRLERFGLRERLDELNSAAVNNARAAGARWVVGSVGPTGEMSVPMGGFTFDDFYMAFSPQIRVLLEAGVDAIALETMLDVIEVKAAVKAVRDQSKEIPLMVQVCLMKGRMMNGTDLPSVAVMLDAMGADVIGMNCVALSAELVEILRATAAVTDRPLIVQPNAGLPDASGQHHLDLHEWRSVLKQVAAAPGVGVIGGCCGTNPEVIRLIREAVDERGSERVPASAVFAAEEYDRIPAEVTYLSGRLGVLALDWERGPYLIGERLNPSGRPDLQQALREGDWFALGEEGLAQAEAGAVILDVNVGLAGIDQSRAMAELVQQLQLVTDLPLMLDSPDPAVLEAGLKVYIGKPVINSCHAGKESLRRVLPLAREYGAAIVGLCMDENGVPAGAEERVQLAGVIVNAALDREIKKRDLFLDPLVLSAAMGTGLQATLKTLSELRRRTGCRCIAGVSNVSFGLPDRALLNRIFLGMAVAGGLDLAIANPLDAEMMATLQGARMLLGNDPDCAGYLRHCRAMGRK